MSPELVILIGAHQLSGNIRHWGGQDADLLFKSMVFHPLLVTRTTTTCEID